MYTTNYRSGLWRPESDHYTLLTNTFKCKGGKSKSIVKKVKCDPFLLQKQSVENAGVAFVNGDNERNDSFENINSNLLRTSPVEEGRGLTISGTN